MEKGTKLRGAQYYKDCALEMFKLTGKENQRSLNKKDMLKLVFEPVNKKYGYKPYDKNLITRIIPILKEAVSFDGEPRWSRSEESWSKKRGHATEKVSSYRIILSNGDTTQKMLNSIQAYFDDKKRTINEARKKAAEDHLSRINKEIEKDEEKNDKAVTNTAVSINGYEKFLLTRLGELYDNTYPSIVLDCKSKGLQIPDNIKKALHELKSSYNFNNVNKEMLAIVKNMLRIAINKSGEVSNHNMSGYFSSYESVFEGMKDVVKKVNSFDLDIKYSVIEKHTRGAKKALVFIEPKLSFMKVNDLDKTLFGTNDEKQVEVKKPEEKKEEVKVVVEKKTTPTPTIPVEASKANNVKDEVKEKKATPVPQTKMVVDQDLVGLGLYYMIGYLLKNPIVTIKRLEDILYYNLVFKIPNTIVEFILHERKDLFEVNGGSISLVNKTDPYKNVKKVTREYEFVFVTGTNCQLPESCASLQKVYRRDGTDVYRVKVNLYSPRTILDLGNWSKLLRKDVDTLIDINGDLCKKLYRITQVENDILSLSPMPENKGLWRNSLILEDVEKTFKWR